MSRIAAAFTDGKSDIRGMYWPKTVISGRIFICFINGRQNRRMKYFHNVYYLHFRFFVLMPPHGEWFMPRVTTLKQLPSNNRLLGRGTKGPGTMKPQNPLRIKHPCLTPFGSPLPLPSAPIAMMVNNQMNKLNRNSTNSSGCSYDITPVPFYISKRYKRFQ